MEQINYTFLNEEERKLYNRILETCNRYGTSISLNGVKQSISASDVLNAVLGDHPAIVYFDRTQIGIQSSAFGGRCLNLKKCISQTKAKTYNAFLQNEIKRIESVIEEKCPATDYEIVQFVYEYLQTYLSYDEEEFQYSCRTGVPKRFNAHDAYGTLQERKGVCDGISSTLNLVLHHYGITSTLVFGKAKINTTLPTEHVWVIVKLNQMYYHLDLTFDISHRKNLEMNSYEYFMLDDKHIRTDHTWNEVSVPKCCSMDMTYFKKRGLYAYTIDHFENIAKKIANSRQTEFRIMFDENVFLPINDREKYISSLFINISLKYKNQVRLSYTWNDNIRVFSCKYL